MKTQKQPSIAMHVGAGIALVFLMFIAARAETAFALSAPTMVLPKEGYTVPPNTNLRVTGLVPKGATVYVFIDTRLVGGVKAKKTKSATASFSFVVKKALKTGKHTVHLQAVIGSDKSVYTNDRTFTIPSTWPRRIDGVLVPAAKANTLPVAVMIENLYTVRPQSGLASASVVYETLAEGGIPRFLALFVRDDMKRVGPVRSARPYFVDWAKEYLGPYFHAGGSRDALNEIGRQHVRSIDALVRKTAPYFFRVGRVASTHNLFTSGAILKKYKENAGLTKTVATFRSWKFKDEPKLAKRPNQKKRLTIDFKSGLSYIVRYSYERKTNSWLRENGGRPHGDANYGPSTQIRAKNVVVQLVGKERVLDAKGHLDLTITGSGKGWLLQDGTLVKITWRKPTASSRTLYSYTNGREVMFNRGPTWIEVVPTNRPVLWH